MISLAPAPRAPSASPSMSRSKWSRRPAESANRPDLSWVWNVPGVLAALKPRDPVSLRIVEELMAAMLTQHGRRMQLHGCDCLTEGGRVKKNVTFPCVHVLQSAQDAALRLILRSEELTEGVSGKHTLDRAARKLALRLPGKPGCWGKADAKDGYHPSVEPVEPTNAEPNTKEKDKVFYDRFKAGESLFHPDDPRYEVPLPEDGEEAGHDD